MQTNPPLPMQTRFSGVVGAMTSLAFALLRCMEGIAAEKGISLIQARLLVNVLDRRPMMSELARQLHMEPSSMTGLVMRAEAHGLLTRRKEGVQTRVHLTEAGLEVAEGLVQRVIEEITERSASLTVDECLLLEDFVSRIVGRTWRSCESRALGRGERQIEASA